MVVLKPNGTFIRVFIAIALASSVVLNVCIPAEATGRAADRAARYHAWTGMRPVGRSVPDAYDSGGSKIIDFSTMTVYPKAGASLTTCRGVTKRRPDKAPASGLTTTGATWKMGVKTMWVEITVQSFRDSVSAYAYR